MSRAVAVIGTGLALVFALGACAAFTDMTGHWILFATAVLVVVTTSLLTGRYSDEAWTVFSGVAVGIGAPICAILGNYFVYQYGIGGLESRDFGSPDAPGWYYIVASVLFLSPLLAGVSALTGLLAWLGHSKRLRPSLSR